MRHFLNSDFVHGFGRRRWRCIRAWSCWSLILAAAFAPWIAPHDPTDLASLSLLDSFKPPWPAEDADWPNPLGTDSQGRDVLSAIMFGMRISLLVGFWSVAIAVVLGIVVGLAAGYLGGSADTILMRIADVQLTFPAILTALMINGIVGAALPRTMRDEMQLPVIIVSIGISLWPGVARTVRGSTLVERNKEYVLAARVIGVPAWRIMLSHVLPNVIGPVLVLATLGLGARDPDRGDVVVSGCRPAADAAVARHADPLRQRLPVLRPMVGDDLSGRDARADGAVDQSARRLAARRAEPEAAMTPLLDVRDLIVEFPTRRGLLRALDRISFSIAAGEMLGVVGESGAGKSLTGAAIVGLLTPPGRIARRLDPFGRRADRYAAAGAAAAHSRPAHRHDLSGSVDHAQSAAAHRPAVDRNDAHASRSDRGRGAPPARSSGWSVSVFPTRHAASIPGRTNSPAASGNAWSSRWRCAPNPNW